MAKKKIDFGQKSIGDRPLPEGSIVLTEAEKKALEAAGGLKDGKPATSEEVKAQLERMWQKEDEDYAKAVEAAVKGKKVPLSFDDVPDISQIPPDKAKSISEIMEKAKSFVEEQKKEEPPPNKVEEPVDTPAEKSTTGAVPTQTHCQHCGWNLSLEDDKPSSKDMFLFTMAELSGKPFQKEFETFGGKLKVVFRTVGVKNSEMSLRQTGYDMAAAGIRTQEEFFVALFNYRLVCSLQRIMIGETEHEIADAVDDYIEKNKEVLGKSTPLPRMLAVIQELSPLNRESVWRLIGENFKKFNKLVSAIEARADDPDFANAIAEYR